MQPIWRGSKSEIYFEDFKTSRTFIFTFYIWYTCVECGKGVMSYFASISSYSNTFLVIYNFSKTTDLSVLVYWTDLAASSKPPWLYKGATHPPSLFGREGWRSGERTSAPNQCDPRPGGVGVLPYKRLKGMCHWMGSHFHNWIEYNGVAFSIELLEWSRSSSYLRLANVSECLYCRWKVECSSFNIR